MNQPITHEEAIDFATQFQLMRSFQTNFFNHVTNRKAKRDTAFFTKRQELLDCAKIAEEKVDKMAVEILKRK